MKRLTKYINKLVNITMTSKIGHDFTMSGHISAVGKEYFLILDQDKREHSYRKDLLNNIVII
jgi:hypothetical protein